MPDNKWKAMRSFATKTRKHLAKSDGQERIITLETLGMQNLLKKSAVVKE